jgi:hypothetical protein
LVFHRRTIRRSRGAAIVRLIGVVVLVLRGMLVATIAVRDPGRAIHRRSSAAATAAVVETPVIKKKKLDKCLVVRQREEVSDRGEAYDKARASRTNATMMTPSATHLPQLSQPELQLVFGLHLQEEPS